MTVQKLNFPGTSYRRYAQRSNYDAGNFIRHFRKLHPLEAFEKNLVRSDMHSAMIAEEQKRIARKHTVSIVPAEVLEACIQLMAVHNLPVQCFGWAGMQTLLDRLTTTFEFKINDHCMVEHIQKSAERMIWIAQQEMRGKLISIHVESMAHGKIHYLIVSAHFTNTRRLITRTLGQIRVTETLPARDAKARFLELLGRYQLSTKQIAVIVLGNIGSVPGTPEKLQSFFADSLIKPTFKFDAPNKEEALLDSLSEELREQFVVVRNVVSVILTALNEMFSDTDPAFVRIDRYLQDLRSPQYEGFFLEHNAPYPPTWHSQWISKFQSVRCIVEQEQLLMKLAQKHPELGMSPQFFSEPLFQEYLTSSSARRTGLAAPAGVPPSTPPSARLHRTSGANQPRTRPLFQLLSRMLVRGENRAPRYGLQSVLETGLGCARETTAGVAGAESFPGGALPGPALPALPVGGAQPGSAGRRSGRTLMGMCGGLGEGSGEVIVRLGGWGSISVLNLILDASWKDS